jgi:Protein of unknown function (DUF559)
MPFTRAVAATYGITPEMLRGVRFRRLAREVYVSVDTPITLDVLCRAASLAMPEGVLSHHSAATALGLPTGVREAEANTVHLTAPVGGRRPAHLPLRCHYEELPPKQVTQTPLGRATSPARTFLDRAAELDLPDLVALGDAIVGRGCATLAELTAIVAWGWGRRGVVNARAALPLIDGRSRSPMESRTRVVLVLGGCPPPEVNIHILDSHGEWLAEGDLVWREAKLIVEYDGEVHLSEKQRRKDAQRHNQLVAEGWTVLHITADDVLRRPWALIALVKRQLTALAA